MMAVRLQQIATAMPQGPPIEQLSRNSVHAPTPHLRQTQAPFEHGG
jgi:hypothetical protein